MCTRSWGEAVRRAGWFPCVRILATLLVPDGGTARVLGYDVAAEARYVWRRVALAGQAATVDDDLTGSENLVLLGRLAGLRWRAPGPVWRIPPPRTWPAVPPHGPGRPPAQAGQSAK